MTARWVPTLHAMFRGLRHLRPRHARILLLAAVVIATDVLFRVWPDPLRWRGLGKKSDPESTTNHSSLQQQPQSAPPPLDWGRGLSVIIPERGAHPMLGECLAALQIAARHCETQLNEPVQIIIVVNDGRPDDYTALRSAYPGIDWLWFEQPLGFTAAVLQGLAQARWGATYLLNNDMLLAPDALASLLRWRDPQVFALASQIFMHDPAAKREETGWTSMEFIGARPSPGHLPPPDDTLRGTVWAGAGSSMFNTAMLRELLPGSLVYDPFYWEDVDLGVRAWRRGYASVVCPPSMAWHKHRATVKRYYSESFVDRVFERNRLQFMLRQPFPRRGLKATLGELLRMHPQTVADLGSLSACKNLWRARWQAFGARWRDVGYATMSSRVYANLAEHNAAGSPATPSAARRPRLLIASPFAVLPPRHGGAVRSHRLAQRLALDFELILLSDEPALYPPPPAPIAPFSALHQVHGRDDRAEQSLAADDPQRRLARMQSHAHPAFKAALHRLIVDEQPAAVLIEHMELAPLIDVRDSLPAALRATPFALSMHDVLLTPDDPRAAAVDQAEAALLNRYDALVASAAEDQALLGGLCSSLIINGVDAALIDGYQPSQNDQQPPRVLFIGPFRAPINWDGLQAFLRDAWPALCARMQTARAGIGTGTAPAQVHAPLTLTIVGGDGAQARAASDAGFAAARQIAQTYQARIEVLDVVDDLHALIRSACLTINPQRQLRGSSLKVIESLALGRICVSTQVGARGRDHAGLLSLITVDQVSAMAEPIASLLLDAPRRWQLERPDAARLQAHTWEAAGDQLRAQLQALTNARRVAA